MKKFLSAILALSMVLSMVGTLGITSYAKDSITIDDFLGEVKYSTGFSWAGINDRTRLYGISNSSIAGAGNLRQDLYPNTHTGTFMINEMTQADGQIGQVLEARTIMGYSYATEDEIDARDAGTYKVNINGSPVNAFYYRFIPSEAVNTGIVNTPACTETNDIHYLITIDSNNLKAWYPITNTGDLDDGNLVEGTYDYDTSLVPTTGDATNRFFTPMWKGAPVMHLYGGLGKDIGLTVNSNSNQRAYFSNSYNWTNDLATKADEKDVGTVIWSFDYKNDGQYVDETTVPGGSINFTLFGNLTMDLHAGLVIPSSRIITVNDENKSTPDSATLYLGETSDVEGTKDSVSDLVAYPAYVPGKWNNVVVSYNLKTSVFKYYVDGKPVYAGLEDGKYYDEFYLAHTTGTFNLATMEILMQRSSRFIDNNFYLDNIKVKYAEPETISKELIWHKISNGQNMDAVTSNLKMSDTIKIDGVNCPITWQSSNENVIALNGTVTRSIATNETVTLTATVGEEEFVFENIVVLSRLGTVLVWDLISNGQPIKAVTDDLDLPTTVSDGEQDFNVTWTSSDTDAISNTGKVARGSLNANVTLTATVEGAEFPFEITVTGKGVIPSVAAGITIDDMPGKVILEQNFENPATSKVGQFINSQAQNSGGFYSTGGTAGANSVAPYIRVVPKTENAENVAIALEPGSAFMYATADEIAEINASEYTVSHNGGAAQKGMHRNFGGVDYIITKDGSNLKAWYKVTNFSEETKAYTSVDTRTNNKWFYQDGKPRDAEIGAMNVYNKIPSDMLKKDDEGNYKGVISYSFKLMTNADSPSNVNGYPSLVLDGISSANNIFALKHDSMVSYYNYAGYKNGEKITISGVNANGCFLGKNANVQGNKTNTDELDLLGTVAKRQEGQWVDYIIVMNLDDNYYSIYIDGKPLYLLSNGVYYNQFAIDTKGDNLLNTVKFNAGRFETYHGDFTYLDDFVVKYYYDNIYDVLTWNMISNGQAIASVLNDISLPEKITYQGKEQTLTWKSSNSAVISTTGAVTRPENTTSVILTATTAAGEEAVFNVTVRGLTGKPAVFFMGDSLIPQYPTDSDLYPEKIQGFGYYAGDYFEGNVSNYILAGAPGHGTMSFYKDPQFYKTLVKPHIAAGDFVIIEFGANDQVRDALHEYTDEDGNTQTVNTHTTEAEYREYLTKYVDEIKALGGQPIFMLPLYPGVGGSVDIDNYTEDTTYGLIMKDVAAELGVDVIDFRVKIIDYIKYLKTLDTTPDEEKVGNIVPSFYEDYMFVADDRTHLTARGAKMYARWMMEAICESTAPTIVSLAEYVNKDMIKPTIYTAGDSLMCDWLKVFGPKWYPYQGWGSFLGDYFEGANVVNTAESGSTSASFYYQKNLMQERVMKHILPGDYLFVSTAPNDESYSIPTVTVTAEEGQIDPVTGELVAKGDKVYKVVSAADSFDGEVHKFGANLTEYANNLKTLYIDEMRKYGVNVVLVTSAAGYSRMYNPSYKFIDTMKAVGAEKNIPVIDLRTKHQQFIVDEYDYDPASGAQLPLEYFEDMQVSRKVMIEKYGFTNEMINAHPGVGMIGDLEYVGGTVDAAGDISHFNIEGAKIAARLAIEALYESNDEKLDGLKSLLDTDKLYLTEEVAISDVSVADTQGGVNISATLTKTEPQLQFNTKAILSAFNGSKLIKSVTLPLLFEDGIKGKQSTLTKNDYFDYTSKAEISATLEGEFNSNTTYKLFVWDMRNLKPVASVTLAD